MTLLKSGYVLTQVKIQGQNEEMLSTACEQFLGKSEHEIHNIALVTLEGHQRAIMGSMTVEVRFSSRHFYNRCFVSWQFTMNPSRFCCHHFDWITSNDDSHFWLQEIYKDRKKFSKEVFEVASSDLVNMGITVVSYTLKDIRDEEVYHLKYRISLV